MKRDVLMIPAERMFIVEQATIETISSELHIAEKTVRNWKKLGDWDTKRAKYNKVKTDFHEDLYVLARKIMKLLQIEVDRLVESAGVGDDEQDSRIESRINSLSRLLDKLPKTKDYETNIKNEKAAEKENSQVITGDMIAQKTREILGG